MEVDGTLVEERARNFSDRGRLANHADGISRLGMWGYVRRSRALWQRSFSLTSSSGSAVVDNGVLASSRAFITFSLPPPTPTPYTSSALPQSSGFTRIAAVKENRHAEGTYSPGILYIRVFSSSALPVTTYTHSCLY